MNPTVARPAVAPPKALTEHSAIFAALLAGTLPLPVAAERLGCDAGRLAIYPNFVRGHVRNALTHVYPTFAARQDAAAWAALAESFRRAHPPSHWVLTHAAEGFPEFVEARVAAGDTTLSAFDAALAELEWTLYTTLYSPPDASAPQTLSVNPTLTVLQSPCRVIPAVLALQAGRPPVPTAPTPTLNLIFRRGDRVAFHEAEDALLFALKVVHEGRTIAEAAAAAGATPADAHATLARAHTLGLLVGPLPRGPDS